MGNGQAMTTLLQKLQAATEPSEELDTAIWIIAKPDDRELIEFGDGRFGKRDPQDGCAFDVAPRYTASVDIALTLIPHGFIWKIFNDYPGTFYWCEIETHDWLPDGRPNRFRSEACASAPFAICEAVVHTFTAPE